MPLFGEGGGGTLIDSLSDKEFHPREYDPLYVDVREWTHSIELLSDT